MFYLGSKCVRCGACCKYFVCSLLATKDINHYLTLHGCYEIHRNEWEISSYCNALDSNGSCAIYQNRPKVCKEFLPGSKECTRARFKVGLSPLQ